MADGSAGQQASLLVIALITGSGGYVMARYTAGCGTVRKQVTSKIEPNG